MQPTYIYVGAGWDTAPFKAEWAKGTIIHCIDGQPHSEYGTKTSFDIDVTSPTYGKNVYSRPNFAKRVLRAYETAGFACSMYDKRNILETGLLFADTHTGCRSVVIFENIELDIIVWYHFNSGLPEHADEIYEMVGAYNGLLCSGHWPHVSITESFDVPDNSLTFHGYPNTGYHEDRRDRDENEQSVVGRLSYDDAYRKKFERFVFHDLEGGENTFDYWDDYLDWIDENPDLAYE
jgi:hypothetical protein